MNHTCKNGHFSKKLLADLIYSVLTLIKLAHLKRNFLSNIIEICMHIIDN